MKKVEELDDDQVGARYCVTSFKRDWGVWKLVNGRPSQVYDLSNDEIGYSLKKAIDDHLAYKFVKRQILSQPDYLFFFVVETPQLKNPFLYVG